MNIQQAIDLMLSQAPDGSPTVFSVKFVKYSQTTKKGGGVRELKRVQLNSQLTGKTKTQFRTIDVKDLDETVPANQVKKIHLDLILTINSEQLI